MNKHVKDLVVGRTYNLRHYGQVWLHMRYEGLVDRGRLCKFLSTNAVAVQFNSPVYFDVTSTRWSVYPVEGTWQPS